MVPRLLAASAILTCLAACDPVSTTGGAPGAAQSDYERHKANRSSYMFQGR